MAGDNEFRHLPLPVVLSGEPKLRGFGNSNDRTLLNRNNRSTHGEYLISRSKELSRFWKERILGGQNENASEISIGMPVLLEVDPSTDIDFLRGLGFEIVCEIENGFIIVAIDDSGLSRFDQKVNDFIKNVSTRCNSPAKIYALCDDADRLDKILSRDLLNKWPTVNDNNIYAIDISISCSGNVELPDKPNRNLDETDQVYSLRLQRWEQRFCEAYQTWDDLKIERERELENFIELYNGKIVDFIDGTSDLVGLPDSFSARLSISGKCLKDIIFNFAYIFEVSESEQIVIEHPHAPISENFDNDIKILSPSKKSPVVCVIDSGIQEQHKYIAQSIYANDSRSLIPNAQNVNDEVDNGGHGTRVAGAILYPEIIPKEGSYQLPCWLRNIRVLDKNSMMPIELLPQKVIRAVVDLYSKDNPASSKIFNHSIGSKLPCELKHMSPWGTEIDVQSYDNDVLFIQAAGNIRSDVVSSLIEIGYPYPDYLNINLSRICDPGQSLQALTVGSVAFDKYETDDQISLGGFGDVSSFSRSGPGIWDTIKPEVVEYGGTEVANKEGDKIYLTTPAQVCPELLRRSPEGPAFSRDAVGTSFAAPKVASVAAAIEQVLPESPALLYRALIAQSARWPDYSFEFDNEKCTSLIRRIGYGIPDAKRATHNDEYRITFITPNTIEIGSKEAHIFRIPIPEQLSSVGENFKILLEVTLSYAAKPRRTRRSTKRYLSTWVEWCCSRSNEDSVAFARRIFDTGAIVEDDGNFNWVIGDAIDHGMVKNYSRKNGTLQKDWCIIESNQLSDSFCIAVRGHKGWGELFKAKYSLVVSFEAINQDILIYEPIRAMVEVPVENYEIEMEMNEKDINLD